MKLFAIALGIVCGVAAVLFGAAFGVLTLLQRPEAVSAAGTLAGLPILAFAKVAEVLEREQGKKSLAAGKRTSIYDFHQFQIAWPLMVLYGTILLFAIVEVTGLVVAAANDLELKQTVQMMPFTAFPVAILGMYFVGRWIGTRCSQRGIIAIVLVAILAPVLLEAFDESVIPDEAYRNMFNHDRLDFGFLLPVLSLRICLFTVAGLLGYWRGHKQKLSKYLHYLLGVLPSETRDAVVDLAFEEAQKVLPVTKKDVARISSQPTSPLPAVS
jgi:hypothetical protein